MSSPSKKTKNKPPKKSEPSSTPAKKPSQSLAGGSGKVSKEKSLSNLSAILALETCEKKKNQIRLIIAAIENKK